MAFNKKIIYFITFYITYECNYYKAQIECLQLHISNEPPACNWSHFALDKDRCQLRAL